MKTLEFPYYLEAWKYCRESNIAKFKIIKKDFRTWILQYNS